MKELHLISLYATLKLETILHQSCRDDEAGAIVLLVGAAVMMALTCSPVGTPRPGHGTVPPSQPLQA